MAEVFLRKASGLVRDVSPKDVLFFNMGGLNIGLGLSFVTLSVAAFYPGASLSLALLIPLAFCLLVTISYLFFTVIMPRSGGEYLFISRGLHPSVGFALSFAYWLMMIYYTAYGAWTVATLGLTTFFQTLGIKLNNQGLIDFADKFTTPWGSFIVGLVVLLLFGALFLSRTRVVLRTQVILFVIAFIGMIALIVALLTISRADFVSAFNAYGSKFGNSFTYGSVISEARKAGFVTAPFSLSATIQAMVWPLFIVAFGAQSAGFAGEIRKVGRASLIGSTGAVALSGILLLVVILLCQHSIGTTFLGAAGYNPPGNIYPWPNLLVAIATTNPLLWVLIMVGFVVWPAMFGFINVFYCTRVAFAWSFDRLIPSWFGKVSATRHTPVNTVLLVFALGIAFLAGLSFLSDLTTLGGIVAMIATIGTACLASAVFPLRKKELFERSPVNYRIAGVPWMTVIGFVSAAFMYFMVYELLTDSLTGASVTRSLLFATVPGVAAFVYFWVMKSYRLRKDTLDIMLAYGDIPSE